MTPYELAEQFITRLCVWREARGASFDAKRGVVHVLLNRAFNPKGPYSKCVDVLANVLCPAQFSCMSPTDPNAHQLPNPKNYVEWTAWEECCRAVDEPGDDPTNGATHYHCFPPGHPCFPKWAVESAKTAQIGAFSFYRL